MTAKVISFPKAAPIPKVKKPFPFLYEILFIRNLLIWMFVGGVLSIFLPTSIIMLGCVVALYIEGKRRI